MVKLPPVEIAAINARDELNRGNREKGLEFLAQAGDGPIARELRAAVQKRGRQPFGAKHLWWNIGHDNDELTRLGVSREDRLETLSVKYRLGDKSKIATALAKYNKALEEIREIDYENEGG